MRIVYGEVSESLKDMLHKESIKIVKTKKDVLGYE